MQLLLNPISDSHPLHPGNLAWTGAEAEAGDGLFGSFLPGEGPGRAAGDGLGMRPGPAWSRQK